MTMKTKTTDYAKDLKAAELAFGSAIDQAQELRERASALEASCVAERCDIPECADLSPESRKEVESFYHRSPEEVALVAGSWRAEAKLGLAMAKAMLDAMRSMNDEERAGWDEAGTVFAAMTIAGLVS